jgi:hypothetical protein
MNNKINGCVHSFDAEAGASLPISKKKSSIGNHQRAVQIMSKVINYKYSIGPPSDDYEHQSELKATSIRAS